MTSCELSEDEDSPKMTSEVKATSIDSNVVSEEEADRNELLEYDLWEGQFSLTSEDEGQAPTDLGSPSAVTASKAIKNAQNQQKLLDRYTSLDLENLIGDFDSSHGFDFESNEKKSRILRQVSSFDASNSTPSSIPKNRMKNGDYILCWNQQQALHEDLSDEVQMLQQQVGHLAESQATTDDKYSKVKSDNTALTARIHMLEEQIRELEVRSDERLEDERKRSKDMLARLEREKQLEIENYAIRLQTLEKEYASLEQDSHSLREHIERLKLEKKTTEDFLIEAQHSLALLQEEHAKLVEVEARQKDDFEAERQASKQLIQDLTKEVELLNARAAEHGSGGILHRATSAIEEDDPLEVLPSRIKELEAEIRNLRGNQRQLEDKNEELMGQILNKGLEEGKSILISTTEKPSIDHEMQELTDNQDNLKSSKQEVDQIRTALRDQKEVNVQLRNYIDGILMNIIEKYPELLEVRK